MSKVKYRRIEKINKLIIKYNVPMISEEERTSKQLIFRKKKNNNIKNDNPQLFLMASIVST